MSVEKKKPHTSNMLCFRYRRRRRKNRYENLVVPSQDYEATLQDNQLYDRDSSYKAPSANYAAPDPSYEAPSYSSYEESRNMIYNALSFLFYPGVICCTFIRRLSTSLITLQVTRAIPAGKMKI